MILKFGFYNPIYLACSYLHVLNKNFWKFILEFSGLFYCSIIKVQGLCPTFVTNNLLLVLLTCCLRQRYIFYHFVFSLSRTFFILFFEAFQKIKLGNLWNFPAFASYKKTFAFKLYSLTDLCDSDIYLTISFRHCQELFSIFCISSHDRPINWILVESTTTEKEGFEPSRRVNDLHP